MRSRSARLSVTHVHIVARAFGKLPGSRPRRASASARAERALPRSAPASCCRPRPANRRRPAATRARPAREPQLPIHSGTPSGRCGRGCEAELGRDDVVARRFGHRFAAEQRAQDGDRLVESLPAFVERNVQRPDNRVPRSRGPRRRSAGPPRGRRSRPGPWPARPGRAAPQARPWSRAASRRSVRSRSPARSARRARGSGRRNGRSPTTAANPHSLAASTVACQPPAPERLLTQLHQRQMHAKVHDPNALPASRPRATRSLANETVVNRPSGPRRRRRGRARRRGPGRPARRWP